MKTSHRAFLLFVVCALSASPNGGQIASGGTYTLSQAVIANGGGSSSGPGYSVEGTTGQSAAGASMSGGTTPAYNVKSGFWIGAAAPPTAAGVLVGGRVTTQNGNGIRNVRVTISGGNLTSPRIALTSSFGYFSFDDVEAGHTYVVSVTAKRYGFPAASQIVSVLENVQDLTFVAGWEN